MKTIFQVEFTSEILEDRKAILQRSGCRVASALGLHEAQALDLAANRIGVVVIGHGALRDERQQLASSFRERAPDITIVCLLRHSDEPIREPISIYLRTTLPFGKKLWFRQRRVASRSETSRRTIDFPSLLVVSIFLTNVFQLPEKQAVNEPTWGKTAREAVFGLYPMEQG